MTSESDGVYRIKESCMKHTISQVFKLKTWLCMLCILYAFKLCLYRWSILLWLNNHSGSKLVYKCFRFCAVACVSLHKAALIILKFQAVVSHLFPGRLLVTYDLSVTWSLVKYGIFLSLRAWWEIHILVLTLGCSTYITTLCRITVNWLVNLWHSRATQWCGRSRTIHHVTQVCLITWFQLDIS